MTWLECYWKSGNEEVNFCAVIVQIDIKFNNFFVQKDILRCFKEAFKELIKVLSAEKEKKEFWFIEEILTDFSGDFQSFLWFGITVV